MALTDAMKNEYTKRILRSTGVRPPQQMPRRGTPHYRMPKLEANGGWLQLQPYGGPEIPREVHQQIFQRFYRLDGTRASGSGLGLAIARELAEVMGGRIELDSQNGWTLFTLALPADVAREPIPA